jgi:hypothetical protein
MYCPYCLFWLFCPSCPVLAIAYACPIPAVLCQLSFPSILSMALLMSLSMGCCHVLTFFSLICPGSPVQAVWSRLTCPGCPFQWSCPSRHTRIVLPWLSDPCRPISFLLPCPICPVLLVLSTYHVLPVLSHLSCSITFVHSYLSPQPGPCCHVLASILSVLSCLTCLG